MHEDNPVLHLICGKIAAGKSTLARKLADAPATVLISEDHWLSRLYPGQMTSVADYVRCSGRLHDAMDGHVEDLLRAGLSVVLDFPANTISQRLRLRAIFENAGVAHQLHYLDLPDDICKARLKVRNDSGRHEFMPSEAEFDLITSYFIPPTPEEGFNLKTYHA